MTELAQVRPAQLRSGKLLEIARAALAEADGLPDIAALVDRAEVVRVAARKARLSLDAINDWAEFKLDAERKAGELLAARDHHPPGPLPRDRSHDATYLPPKLADLGVRKDQAHRWQQVASLPEPEYEAYKAETRADGDIISTAGAVARARELERERRDTELAARPIVMPAGRYPVIVADPPWGYDNAGTRAAAVRHYPTMTVEEVCKLDLAPRLADDAHLYLWTTNPFLPAAFAVLDAWGFTYKTCLTWVKPQIGLGNYFRSASEHVLFGVRGDLAVRDRAIPTWFQADRTEHSAKPDAFYELVERASAGPYLELFARRQRPGWDAWGFEA